MLRFLTAGESHGPKLTAILDGIPANLPVSLDDINLELRLRQGGIGRSSRQKIESDQLIVVGGIRHGLTTGGPIGLEIINNDYQNWHKIMSVWSDENSANREIQDSINKLASFRPGHADLAGLIKFKHNDIRNVLERASARETAIRVGCGAICLTLLNALGIKLASHVTSLGGIESSIDASGLSWQQITDRLKSSSLYCLDQECELHMVDLIKATHKIGDSLGGCVEVIACDLPVGLGSYTQWDKRLDGLLAQSLMSIQAVKVVEIGNGIKASSMTGSSVHDALYLNKENSKLPFKTNTNNSGGIDGGMTNGQRLVVRAFMKPIPTITKGLPTLSYPDFNETKAFYERSDVCAISSLSIIAKAMTAFTLAQAILDKFGGDDFNDLKLSVDNHFDYVNKLVNKKSI